MPKSPEVKRKLWPASFVMARCRVCSTQPYHPSGDRLFESLPRRQFGLFNARQPRVSERDGVALKNVPAVRVKASAQALKSATPNLQTGRQAVGAALCLKYVTARPLPVRPIPALPLRSPLRGAVVHRPMGRARPRDWRRRGASAPRTSGGCGSCSAAGNPTNVPR